MIQQQRPNSCLHINDLTHSELSANLMEGRIIMSFAMNGDIRIYYEIEGNGPLLILHHGFSSSLEGWQDTGSFRNTSLHRECLFLV